MATDKGKETRKMMLYVGGAAAVVALLGGYWLFGSSDEPATGGSQVKAQGLEGKTGREKANDPQYNKLLNEWNADNSEKAALTGIVSYPRCQPVTRWPLITAPKHRHQNIRGNRQQNSRAITVRLMMLSRKSVSVRLKLWLRYCRK